MRCRPGCSRADSDPRLRDSAAARCDPAASSCLRHRSDCSGVGTPVTKALNQVKMLTASPRLVAHRLIPRHHPMDRRNLFVGHRELDRRIELPQDQCARLSANELLDQDMANLFAVESRPA